MAAAMSRREWMRTTSMALGIGMAAGLEATLPAATEAGTVTGGAKLDVFRLCLNTSTIRGQKLPLAEVVEIAAKAGYHAIEPWIDEIQHYKEGGGSLPDLRKRIADHGMTVEDGIGFAEWIVDDSARRAKGLETARHDMELLAQIGGKRIAAPPMGATEQTDLNLHRAAERYAALCAIGEVQGIVPMVEVWGFSKSLTRLSEAAHVAIESGAPNACVLADVYHLHKGGSDYHGLRLLRAEALPVLHMNDYPAAPPPETITDADRVYPGDGVAPILPILRLLKAEIARGSGSPLVLSLELFNTELYKQDPLTVARTGYEKMHALVSQV